jgi:two-component system nitrogen regulation sensor histidine kinase NtrY
MAYNRFYISIILYCILIFVSLFLCFFFYYTREQPNTAIGMLLLALLFLFRLIFHVNRTNRILGNFLVYMHEKDPSLSYTLTYSDKNFKGLSVSLGMLIRDLKESRIDLEVQAQTLESILSNVSTGILTVDNSGKIGTMNRAAREILGTGIIKNIEELNHKLPGLGSRMLAMKPDEQRSENIRKNGKSSQLTIQSSIIKLKSETLHILALNDISNQMEEQEIRSWKKLIRVINHEIMNSMTPIITLAGAIRRKLSKGDQAKPVDQISKEALVDALRSSVIIEERSRGLVSFIERYKKLTGLPPLKIERFPAGELMEKIEFLFKEEMNQQSIQMSCTKDRPIELEADKEMMEQVLINLVKNAADALQQTADPKIELRCYRDSGDRPCIHVVDNGKGIDADKLDQVFVPFFTTKEEGSGIGLSLCKQIIQLHQGRIDVDSTPGEGTRVTIRL